MACRDGHLVLFQGLERELTKLCRSDEVSRSPFNIIAEKFNMNYVKTDAHAMSCLHYCANRILSNIAP